MHFLNQVGLDFYIAVLMEDMKLFVGTERFTFSFFLINRSFHSILNQPSFQSVMDHQNTAAMRAATEKLCLHLHSYFGERVIVPSEFNAFVFEYVLELLLSMRTAAKQQR